jgi:hypothetical protein
METRTVRSTSRRTATTEDLILRDGPLVRLVFRPMLVDNTHEPSASVKGAFIYRKKNKSGTWEDSPPTPLNKLKVGEEYRLELRSEELLRLFGELDDLYEFRRDHGIPRGEMRFVKARSTVQALSLMTDEEIHSVVVGTESIGASAVARLIRWAGKASNFELLFERLEELEPDSLKDLNAAVGLATLHRALKEWAENRDNANEEFWQEMLARQAFVLEQVFSLPMVVIQQKAYVGGKSVANTGGHIADFLVKNQVTQEVGLVEIKTPATPLLGSEYRQGVYSPSSALAGAVQQVLVYRHSLIEQQRTLLHATEMRACSPRCIVLVGHARKQLAQHPQKQLALELFRNQLHDVQVISFDEMFDRTKRLAKLLEKGVAQ